MTEQKFKEMTDTQGDTSGGCNFYIKNKLKSEIFNDKKSLYTKMFLCRN